MGLPIVWHYLIKTQKNTMLLENEIERFSINLGYKFSLFHFLSDFRFCY